MSTFDLFNKALQKAGAWIREVAEEMDTEDEQLAYHALRSVLHALRDRLIVDEAVQLAAQLPVLIRGIYFEDWDPSKTPVKVRHREEFLDLVRRHAGKYDRLDPGKAAPAVFAVLKRHVSEGEMRDVNEALPGEIRELLAA